MDLSMATNQQMLDELERRGYFPPKASVTKKPGLYNKYTVIDNQTGKPVEYDTFTLVPHKDRAAMSAIYSYTSVSKDWELCKNLLEWMDMLEKAGLPR